jgi:hypothetical protein
VPISGIRSRASATNGPNNGTNGRVNATDAHDSVKYLRSSTFLHSSSGCRPLTSAIRRPPPRDEATGRISADEPDRLWQQIALDHQAATSDRHLAALDRSAILDLLNEICDLREIAIDGRQAAAKDRDAAAADRQAAIKDRDTAAADRQAAAKDQHAAAADRQAAAKDLDAAAADRQQAAVERAQETGR